MPSLFHAFNFRTAKRRGLAPTLLLVSLHPLIYRRDYILIHALASGGGSGLYTSFLPLGILILISSSFSRYLIDAFFCASLTDILLTFRGRPEMRHTLFIVPLL